MTNPTPAEQAAARRAVAAATIGNGLEFYDFVTFAFFAVQIGKTFFPSTDPFVSLMGSLATFGAGFITRPIGAWVLGGYADRHGRKPAMLFSMTLMGVAIAVMALTPGYDRIGIIAPIIVVLARVAQGFALGGEVGSATTYMMEAVSPGNRGFSMSWQGASQQISASVGAAVGLVLSLALSDAELTAWGWRIALLLGTVVVPFALILRKSLPETRDRPEHADHEAFAQTSFRRAIPLGLVIMGTGTIATYMFNYMATYGQTTLGLPTSAAMAGELANNATGIVAVLFGGWLSDRYGRRLLMVVPALLFVVAIVPSFAVINQAPGLASFIGANIALSLFSNMSFGAVYAAISESLPKAMRARGFALVYALPVTILGGTTQPVIATILRVTGNPMSVAWYLTGVATIGAAAMLAMRESAPARRKLSPLPA